MVWPQSRWRFYATINNGSSIVPSIWSAKNGTLAKIAMIGDPAPGGQTYGSFLQRQVFSADDGSVVFAGNAAGLATIWYSVNGSAGVVVQDGQTVPGLSQGTFEVIQQANVAVSGGGNPKTAFLANIAMAR
jgi:hypothetical protein